VYLNVARHDRFRRDGSNIYTDLPIAFTLAALGGTIDVPSLDGASPVQIAAGTQSGTTFRVRSKGMPSVRGGTRGDLLATVHVVVPQKLSRRERELLEEFAEVGGDQIDDRSFFDRVKDAFTP
jgi:molecular chaperone DnaJ